MSPIPMNKATVAISLAMQHIAAYIQTFLNTIADQQVDFFFVVYTQGRSNYVGSADRQANIEAVRGVLNAWKTGDQFPPVTTGWAVNVCGEMPLLASALDHTLFGLARERIAFGLFVFTPGRASYIGTAQRADTVREMNDLLADWDRGMEDVPAHSVAMH